MKKFLLILSLSAAALVTAQVSEARVRSVLSHLASDEMKGREIGTPENDSAAIYIARQFADAQLDFCTGDSYLVPFEYKGKVVYNVCGLRKGKSDNTLAFTAHFDHIGTSANKTGDTVYNGADDNASGVTAVIGLADYFKDSDNDFTIMYIAFNGEEKGMKGSKAIAELPALQPRYQAVRALFNFEMVATVSQFGPNTLFMTGDEFSDLDELLNAAVADGLKIHPDPYAKQQLFYRSDNVSFVKKKVIAHSFSTVDMNNARHYHQLNDDISVVDFTNLTQLINSVGRTIDRLDVKTFRPAYTDRVNFK